MQAATAANEFAIDLHDVAKTYKGKVQALRGVEMRVRPGEIFGLLGPNGAGKSTLVKILLTIVRPTACRGVMLGASVGHKATLRRVGYLPEHLRFPDYLTGAQALDYFAALADVPRRERRARADELLELTGMTDWKSKRIKGYSKGMKQRMGIAQALMNRPDLVFLDEPTDGVDPVGRRDIRNLIVRLKAEGKTIFINSHLLSELEMVCDRVAIMVKGQVAQQGTIDELTEGQRRYEIEFAPPATGDLHELMSRALPGRLNAAPDRPALLRGSLESGVSIEIDRATVRIGTEEAEAAQPVIDALRRSGVVIRSMRSVRPSLEDLFMVAVTDPTTGQELKPGAARPVVRGRGHERGEAPKP